MTARSSTVLRNAGKPFSASAVASLRTRAGKSSAQAIAKTLGRTVKAVRRKAEKLGLSLSVR